MKIKLTLESGLEADFIPDFKLDNHSQIDKVKWKLPEEKQSQNPTLLDPKSFFVSEIDEEDT